MITIPNNYHSKLDTAQTQNAIKIIRDKFQKELGYQLDLQRVSAPLFLPANSGLNDDLSGSERKVEFDAKSIGNQSLQVVQSLAKWKRYALNKYQFKIGNGLYTNMNAIRRDEDLDNLHSIYVDQWDWEKVISEHDRTIEYLQQTVRSIYKVIKHIEHEVWYVYPNVIPRIPEEVTFIDSQELLDKYPNLSNKERENKITKDHGAVFVQRIGAPLSNGLPHDNRAPDYDDWQLNGNLSNKERENKITKDHGAVFVQRIGAPLSNGLPHDNRAPDYDDWQLNGDLLIWFEPLQCALEISSMGIRVNAQSLQSQLQASNTLERLNLPYHQAVLKNEYPFTIGGGIGQSRLCMLLAQSLQSQLQASNTLERLNLPYHQAVLKNEYPFTIGGGIGQSRLCMLLLQKVHIGEVQSSIWDDETLTACHNAAITLL